MPPCGYRRARARRSFVPPGWWVDENAVEPPSGQGPQRDQRSQPPVAQVEGAPEKRPERDREQDGERPLTGPDVRIDRPTQVAGQQDGTQDRRPGEEVQDRAGD